MTTYFSKTQRPMLYGLYKSSCSWRVRAALAYKDIEFDQKAINEETSEQDLTEFAALNSLRQVPTLVMDGHTFTQSVAIMEYIEESRPQKPLLPRDSSQRAKVRQIVELINSGIQPLQNPSVAKRFSADEQKQQQWQIYWIEKGLTALETLLKESSGKYCVGDESISFADIALVPQMFAARRFGVDIDKFPVCLRLFEDLLQLEAFRKTHPYNQPDTPDDQRGPI